MPQTSNSSSMAWSWATYAGNPSTVVRISASWLSRPDSLFVATCRAEAELLSVVGGERISSTVGEKMPPDDSDRESLLNSSASKALFMKVRVVVFVFLDAARSLTPCERPELIILEAPNDEGNTD